MRRTALAWFAMMLLALPQVAQAQSFGASYRYTAKFLCGRGENESSTGVVIGHYNTTVNIQAYRNGTAASYRATALASNFDIELGVPSDFFFRLDLDRDQAMGAVCYYVKMLLGVADSTGFVEGYLNVYSNKPLDVVSVVTAEGGDGVSTVSMLPAGERRVSETIRPMELPE